MSSSRCAPARWAGTSGKRQCRRSALARARKACSTSERSLSSIEKSLKGLLSLDAVSDLVGKEEIETVVVGFTDHYGRLLGKRFDAEMFVENVVSQGAHACDYLFTVDMEMEPVPGYRFANWELGYGDVHLVPDLATLRRASWLDGSAFVLCDVNDEKTQGLVAVAPRTILRRQVEAAGKHGYDSF